MNKGIGKYSTDSGGIIPVSSSLDLLRPYGEGCKPPILPPLGMPLTLTMGEEAGKDKNKLTIQLNNISASATTARRGGGDATEGDARKCCAVVCSSHAAPRRGQLCHAACSPLVPYRSTRLLHSFDRSSVPVLRFLLTLTLHSLPAHTVIANKNIHQTSVSPFKSNGFKFFCENEKERSKNRTRPGESDTSGFRQSGEHRQQEQDQDDRRGRRPTTAAHAASPATTHPRPSHFTQLTAVPDDVKITENGETADQNFDSLTSRPTLYLSLIHLCTRSLLFLKRGPPCCPTWRSGMITWQERSKENCLGIVSKQGYRVDNPYKASSDLSSLRTRAQGALMQSPEIFVV
ncbi:hypothetical protein J6590_041808 [Homalodisca vitripennis]|nr:hypothetical protein J6590_041808 [Homalodisca vitripennis]